MAENDINEEESEADSDKRDREADRERETFTEGAPQRELRNGKWGYRVAEGGVFVLYKFGENEQLIMQVKKIILI